MVDARLKAFIADVMAIVSDPDQEWRAARAELTEALNKALADPSPSPVREMEGVSGFERYLSAEIAGLEGRIKAHKDRGEALTVNSLGFTLRAMQRAAARLAQLEQEHQTLQQQVETLQRDNERLAVENVRLDALLVERSHSAASADATVTQLKAQLADRHTAARNLRDRVVAIRNASESPPRDFNLSWQLGRFIDEMEIAFYLGPSTNLAPSPTPEER